VGVCRRSYASTSLLRSEESPRGYHGCPGNSHYALLLGCCPLGTLKVEAPITDKGHVMDFIFKRHTFLRHVSMHAIDNCLKLKLSRIGSSTLIWEQMISKVYSLCIN
jgi:hypothetical protein